MIEDVVPNPYSANQPDYPSSNDDEYEVSSAPAFGSPSNRRDSIVESPYGYQVYSTQVTFGMPIYILRSGITDPLTYHDKIYFQIPAEQKNLQAAVLSGANAYGDYAGRQNVR